MQKGLLNLDEGLPVNRHAINRITVKKESFKPQINKISKYMKRDIFDLFKWNENI